MSEKDRVIGTTDIGEHVRRLVDQAPPLTLRQREVIASALTPSPEERRRRKAKDKADRLARPITDRLSDYAQREQK